MQPDDILDKNFAQLIHDYQLEHEGVEWTGVPKPGFNVFMLEYDGYYDVMSGGANLLSIIMGATTISAFIFYVNEIWTGVFLTILIGLALIFFPDLIMYIRRKRTRYVVTKNRLIFKLWWWGRESIHSIDLADVTKVIWQEYPDKRGIIHFITAGDPGFYTYDFKIARRRDYPTFEMVDEAVALATRIEQLRLERAR